MPSNSSINFISTVMVLALSILILVPESESKPWAHDMSLSGQPAPSESGQTSCPEETKNLCQRCAKQTKSPVVYPWCCTNYEAAQEWCVEYLEFGLPPKPTY